MNGAPFIAGTDDRYVGGVRYLAGRQMEWHLIR
jgi:hypothetical protein